MIPFHRLKQPDLANRFNKGIESPNPNLRLACKQIHSEVKDMVFKVNTYKIFVSDCGPEDGLLASSKSPFWSKIGNFELHAEFPSFGTW